MAIYGCLHILFPEYCLLLQDYIFLCQNLYLVRVVIAFIKASPILARHSTKPVKWAGKMHLLEIQVYFGLTHQQQLKHFREEGGEQLLQTNDCGQRSNVIRLERRLI